MRLTKEEMKAYLKRGELYSPEAGMYIYADNEGLDNLVVYYLSMDEAKELSLASCDGEYWGAILGPGGRVYDDPDWKYDELIQYEWVDTREVK